MEQAANQASGNSNVLATGVTTAEKSGSEDPR